MTFVYITLFLLLWTIASIAWFFHRLGSTQRIHWLDYILFPPAMVVAWTIGLFQ